MPPSLPLVALTLGLTAPAAAQTIDHSTRLDHHSGPVTARYRGTMTLEHRQIGAVVPGGRTSSLRCQWTASLAVERHATTAAGSIMRRGVRRDDVASGHRPGWCAGQREAIARDVAAQTIAIDQHVQAVAREDHDVLRAELDRLHGSVAAG